MKRETGYTRVIVEHCVPGGAMSRVVIEEGTDEVTTDGVIQMALRAIGTMWSLGENYAELKKEFDLG